MTPLHLFVDHCVSTSVYEALKQKGYQVSRLSESMPANSPDHAVIAKALQLGAVLVTHDSDFCDIVRFPPASYAGIIALQVKDHPEVLPHIMTRLLTYLAASPQAQHYRGKLFIVETHRIRVVG